MSKIITIYCEGKAGSFDFDIISKVIDGLTVKITPIGGKRGAKSAIQVHESGTSKSDFKLFFRDRDFDIPVPLNEKLTSDGSYVYFSYRTTIENYLINKDFILEYSNGKSWYSENLDERIYNCAKSIRYFQTLRHTLGKLRVPTDFGTNITDKSGILPDDLSKEFCLEEGFKKIKESIDKTIIWKRESYEKVFNEFDSLFSDKFIESDKFLVYFQGKDYVKALCNELSGFSPTDYYKFAKYKFDFKKHKDLVELRDIIRKKM